MDSYSAGVFVAIAIYVVGFIVAILILSAVIRNAVRKGVEDVLYKKGKDGLWSANPWIVTIAKEIAAETRKTGS
ncbi:hypothetical protein [Herbiconiux sp.]|uniref:hypothetical protein n=1 Tax=Herbiconiux sp. TaxID=1871186 RepID=UPI0025C390CE|nr:hypothetical protein [Herbiconiux sp.]